VSKLTPINQIPGTESPQSAMNRVFGLSQAANGGIDFGESTQTDSDTYTGNMNGQWANVTAPAANTEFAIPHTLGRIPSFYFYITDVSANIYQLPDTGTAWTETNIYVKSSVTGAKIRVFIT
jgi:hypothetical protein